MKKISLFPLLLAVLLFTFSACGESEEERRAREQARLDSLRAVEQARVAEMMAQMQDSIDAAEATEPEMDSTDNTPSGSYEFVEDGSYVVQVGAWRSEDKAQSFVDKWADRNYPSSYVVKHGNEATGDVWFRVRIGNFGDKASAEQLGAELANEINTGYWVANRN